MKPVLIGLTPVVLILSGVTVWGLTNPHSLVAIFGSGGPEELGPYGVLVFLGGLQVLWAVFIVGSR